MQTQLDLDDALIVQFLGSRYLGRRYLRYAELEALGLVDNRASLKLWMDDGAFPRGLKISGPTGKTLLWPAVEVAQLIAQRIRERDDIPAEAAPLIDEMGAPLPERPSDDSDTGSFGASRNNMDRLCLPRIVT
jgi:predicted DNA-binding transcriptional regulator AlpA